MSSLKQALAIAKKNAKKAKERSESIRRSQMSQAEKIAEARRNNRKQSKLYRSQTK